MVKDKKTIKTVQIIIFGLIILFFLAICSGKIYKLVGERGEEICWQAIGLLGVALVGVVGFQYGKEIYNDRYSYKSEKVWQDIMKGAHSKVLLYLKNNENKMPISEVLQLMEIYSNDSEIFDRLLNEVIILYENGDDLTKSTLSFILLKNEGHNKVAMLFEKNKRLRKECKEISKGNCDSIKCNFTDLQEEVNEKRLVIIFQKLLHSCLPTNSISEEEMVNLLKFILGWILKNVSKENIDSYQESMSIFILLLPAIKNKLNKNNIDDGDIVKSLYKIENSKWFKHLLYKSYEYIDFSLCRNEKFLIKNENWIKYLCITSMYYEKMFFWKKMKVLHKIGNMQQKLYKEYDIEKVVLFVLLASPIRTVKSSDDVVYNCLSLIYQCISPLINDAL